MGSTPEKITETTPFRGMLSAVLDDGDFSQRDFAAGIGISASFLCDLLQGKRGPSPSLINKICAYMGRGPKGRKEWHLAGARTDGWEI